LRSLWSDWRPRLESPQSVRRFLWIAALASTAILIYASLVPLNYRPLDWSASWDAWRQIPWFNLDIYRRADWVANALVVLPAGILAAAAVDWGRESSWPLVLMAPWITFVLAMVVVGIELVQVWFPPRTVSLNDIAAGFVGAALGPVLWSIVGQSVEGHFARFYGLPRVQDRIAWLCAGWLVALLILSALPLDVILSQAEWQEKVSAGRVQLNPFVGGAEGQRALAGLDAAVLACAPLGFFCFVTRPQMASLLLWGFPVALQLIQLPMFSRSLSTAAIVGGWIGGWGTYWLASELPRWSRLLRKPAVWGCGWGAACLFALFYLLRNYDEVVASTDQIQARFANAWSFPLVKYYAKSEYGAFTNILEKMAVFALIGACCAGWARTVQENRRQFVVFGSLLVAALIAIGTEVVQIYLVPLVPDMSDVLVYMAGYGLGYYLTMFVTAPAGRIQHSARSEYFPEDTLADFGFVLATPAIQNSRQRLFWLMGGLALMAFAAHGSLVPWNYTPRDFDAAIKQLLATGKSDHPLSSVDWGVNVMLLIPAGFCLAAATWARNASLANRVAWSVVVLCGCATFSVLIELAQSWFPPRVPSVADIVAQICGAVIGIVCWWIFGPWINRLLEEVSLDDSQENRLGLILSVYVAGLLFFSLSPLDLTLHPADLVDKYQAGRILLVPFAAPLETWSKALYGMVADILLFIPVGVFAATFLARRNQMDRSLAKSLLLGALIVVAVEAMQLLVKSRYTETTDVLTGWIGVTIGVFGYRYFRGTDSIHVRDLNLRSWWLALLIVSYSGISLLIWWWPFQFDFSNLDDARQRVSEFFSIPLARSLEGSYLAALDGILRKFLSFMPLGIMVAFAFAPMRRDVRLAGQFLALLLIVGLAVVIEMGQLFLPGTFVSFDDALVSVAGACTGFWLAQRFVVA
jgi:glycopeptide antibiotics resistance protein